MSTSDSGSNDPKKKKIQIPSIKPELLEGLRLTGQEDPVTRGLAEAAHVFRNMKMVSLRPLLPLLLSMKGQPYTLAEHYPFEAFFRTRMPRKTVLKSGRQCGKTISINGKSKVYLVNGRRVDGTSLKIGDKVLSVDACLRVVAGLVIDTIVTPEKQVLKIRTRMGADMEIATTHPLRTISGWVCGGDLKVGDRIATVRKGGIFGSKFVDRDRIILTAYIIGDGHCVTSVGLTSNCNAVIDEAVECGLRVQGSRPRINEKPGTTAKMIHFAYGPKQPLRVWLDEDGLYGKRAYEKHLPAWVFDLSEVDTVLFLTRLWATDGMVKQYQNKPQISYCSTSKELAFDVKSLLLKFGIPSSVRRRTTAYTKNGVRVPCRDAYTVRVETQAGWCKFLATFDVPGKPAFTLKATKNSNNRDTLPKGVNALIMKLSELSAWKHKNSLCANGLRRTLKYSLTTSKALEYLNYFKQDAGHYPSLSELEALVTGDVHWDTIIEITPAGLQPCWDIEVETHHNYCLDGVVSHNSTALAARNIVHSAVTPYYSTLFITPLFEMIRRFSQNYIRPLIDQSPVRSLLVSPKLSHSVLQRTFRNDAQMIFSFMFNSADRVRGISSDEINIDELQDIDKDLLPIVVETMSGSKYGGIQRMAGTPKSLENTIEMSWQESSQAEWAMKCTKCGKWNIPALSHDLVEMIGPWHDDISRENPGIVCAYCRQPKSVFSRNGRWLHTHPERRWDFSGYHVPQIIMPMHCENPEKWATLLAKQQGQGNTPINVFYNEVCGESYDTGSRIVTLTELKAAAILPWKVDKTGIEAAQQISRYQYRVLAVDWGGGGQDGMSYTCYAVLGFRPDGRIDVIWGHRSLTPHDHQGEAALALQIISRFKCHMLAHDYTGAGSLRETFIVQAGYPLKLIVNVSYVRAASTSRIMTFKDVTKLMPRSYYQVDKARSLLLTCNQIKSGWLRFFQWDFINSEDTGLIYDFIALVDEKVDSRIGKDVYTIIRDPALRDDFAQAVNIGCCTLWNMTDKWPQVAAVAALQLDEQTLNALHPFDKDVKMDAENF